MFTKKHYKAIAGILRDVAYSTEEPCQLDTIRCITEDLSAYFKSDNPNFDRSRFFEAVREIPEIEFKKSKNNK